MMRKMKYRKQNTDHQREGRIATATSFSRQFGWHYFTVGEVALWWTCRQYIYCKTEKS